MAKERPKGVAETITKRGDTGYYPKTRESGVKWLGEIPSHWEVMRLGNAAEVMMSNVDKSTVQGEVPVRLCNYVDVYKNERVTDQLDFMNATATTDEIKKFHLDRNDVLLTKDSEEWDDIGIPSLVQYTAPDLICGYHLAILRPYTGLVTGPYLLRVLQSRNVALQFHVQANGVTRYGLTFNGIKNIRIPIPPKPEQDAIAQYLDYLDSRLELLRRSYRRLMSLIDEQKQVIIQDTVIHGVARETGTKRSEVTWIDDIPSNWVERRAKFFLREIDERSTDGKEELLSVSHITGVSPRSQKSVYMFKASSYVGHKLCQPGDLVINTMWAWMGAMGIAKQAGLVSPSYAVYRLWRKDDFVPDFLDYLLRTLPFRAEFMRRSTGIRPSRLRLYPDKFLQIPLIQPPGEEQEQITNLIRMRTQELDSAIASVRREIALISEYRTKLISDVATGKLDIRGRIPEQANESDNHGVPEPGRDEGFDTPETVMDVEHNADE